jgi:hypothetical protein
VNIFKNKKYPEVGHIHKNCVEPTTEHINYLFNKNEKIDSKIEKVIQGKLAEKMSKFINENYLNYKHKNQYKLLGPNCKTYIQWIINKFPQAKVKLPFLTIRK